MILKIIAHSKQGHKEMSSKLWAPRNSMKTEPQSPQEADGDWKGLCASQEILCKMQLEHTNVCDTGLWKLSALFPLWI